MRRDEIRQKLFGEPRHDVTATVEVCGGTPITLRKLSWSEVQECRRMAFDGDVFRGDWYYVAMLVLSARDQYGQPIFEPIDRDDLLGWDAGEMDRLVQGLLALHGMTREAEEARKND